MKYGVVSLVIGILALIFEGLLQPFFTWIPITHFITYYIVMYFGWIGLISLLIFLLILNITAVAYGIVGVKKDESKKGIAKGGIAVGIIGIIFNVVELYFWAYIIAILPYI